MCSNVDRQFKRGSCRARFKATALRPLPSIAHDSAGHGSDRWPCTVIEGSRRNGLGPNQAALVKGSALGADDNLPPRSHTKPPDHSRSLRFLLWTRRKLGQTSSSTEMARRRCSLSCCLHAAATNAWFVRYCGCTIAYKHPRKKPRYE